MTDTPPDDSDAPAKQVEPTPSADAADGRAALLRVIAIGIGCAVLFVAAHPPMWRADEAGAFSFPSWDLTRVFWADLVFARDAVAEGVLPLWNPWDRGGYPFIAEPQSGMFDPVTWLLIVVGLVIGSAPGWLIVLKAVLHYAIAGAGMASFFRERRLPTWAITFGTLAFLWSPRMDKLKDQSALWPTAWTGWLLLATDRVARAPTRWRGLWLGAAVGAVVNAGYPPTAFRLGLLVAPWGAVIVATRLGAGGSLLRAVVRVGAAVGVNDAVRAGIDALGWTDVVETPPPPRAGYLRALAWALGIAVLVAAALCGGQIWATLSVLSETTRAAMDTAHVLASRTHPEHAWGVFAPGTTKTELVVYPGFVVAVATLVAVVASRRAEAVVFALVGAFGFVLACGEHLPVLSVLVDLPGFRSFRIASHYLTLTTVGFVIAGTFGVARLSQLKGEARWIGALAAGFGVSAWATHASSYSAASVAVVLVSAALVVLMSFGAAHRQTRMGWALVFVLATDLWFAGRPVADILRPLPRPRRANTMLKSMGDAQTRSVYRIADFGYAGDRVGPRHHVRDITGHRPALTDPRYLELYALAQRSSNILRAANVSVVGFGKRVTGSELTRDLRSVRKRRGLFTVVDPWPMAFWTDRVAVVDESPGARVWLRMQREPAAVIERPLLPDGFDEERWGTHLPDPGREPPRSVGAQLLEHRPNQVRLRIDAPRDGLFVLVESFDVGWTATVDGEPTDVLRANTIFRAVTLEAGEHEVVFTYQPKGVAVLWWLWALVAAGLTLVGLGSLLVRRRPPQLDAPSTGAAAADSV